MTKSDVYISTMQPVFSSQSLYQQLFDYGCCDICCLRFLKAYLHKDYDDIDAFLLKVG